jgi:hypothetical protein
MSSGVTVKGYNKAYRKLKKAMPKLDKRVPIILGQYGAKMVKYARSNHEFTTQAGQLERAIQSKVNRKQWILTFKIDEVRVYSNGYNYGWIQNDGSAAGYRRGAISPAITPRGKGRGVQADDFMGRAWNENEDDLTKDLKRELIKAIS